MSALEIVDCPRVTLVARQQWMAPDHIGWESDSEVAAEALTEFAGRICYLSLGERAEVGGGHRSIAGRTSNSSYLENILKVKHGSVLEHAVWSVLIEGVSRSLTHELVRHRAGFSFSMLSQRFVDESEIAFVLPPEIARGTVSFGVWCSACEAALAAYGALLAEVAVELEGETEGAGTMRRKRVRQAARSVLPNCAETKIVVTGNARAWRHFVEMRGGGAADVEIRRLAVFVVRLLMAEAPHIFGDMEVLQGEDGTEVVRTEFTKV